ncbi:hypothetical protein NQZ68_028986, partial [Dissostichus eleginoides]
MSPQVFGSLFWIRIVSGDFPEVLRKTFSLKSNDRITATEERELFVLHIKEAKLSDAAVYYCIQISQQNLRFLTQTDLRVEEPEITAVSPTDPVHPGDSVTLQCSILSDSENKTRLEEHNLCCFKAFNQVLIILEETVLKSMKRNQVDPQKRNVSTACTRHVTAMWPHVRTSFLEMDQNSTLQKLKGKSVVFATLLLPCIQMKQQPVKISEVS